VGVTDVEDDIRDQVRSILARYGLQMQADIAASGSGTGVTVFLDAGDGTPPDWRVIRAASHEIESLPRVRAVHLVLARRE